MVIEPPSETPKRCALSLPALSRIARMSSVRSSSVATAAGRSESPVPRLSKRISRQNLDKRSMKRPM